MWLNVDQMGSLMGVISSAGGDGYWDGWRLIVLTDGRLSFNVSSQNYTTQNYHSTLVTDAGTGELVEGNWHNVICTYDGTTMRVYLDGNLVGENVFEGFIDYPNEFPMRIGYNPSVGYFDGSIDELRIYDYALNPHEVNDIFTGVNQ